MNGGALSEYIMKEHLFTENEIAEYTCQIAEGLIELRSKGIIHRDLRPENILFHNKQIKFADFDAAFIKDYSDYRNIKNGVDRKDTTPYEIMMLMAE
jgi:serine/threonine protein kinase